MSGLHGLTHDDHQAAFCGLLFSWGVIVNLYNQEEKESFALRMRLHYELGLWSAEDLKRYAAEWNDELKREMRDLYKHSVSKVTRTPSKIPLYHSPARPQ